MSDEGVNTSMEAPAKPVGADHVEYDGQSTIHGPEEVVSAEQLQLIKARTMYQMVEDIDGGSAGKRRIIFLTNAQAELIARQENAIGIKRLVQALEIVPPKLIINIISSWGFSEFSRQCPWWQGGGAKDWNLGMVHNRSPFVTLDEEKRARERIDAFMLDVIIPLAAKTNAVILCEAVKQACVVSASLRRCVSLVRAKWNGKLPFTILSVTSETACFYCNANMDAEWRRVRRACRAWRDRDKLLVEQVHSQWGGLTGFEHDLDPNADLLMVVDAYNEKKNHLHQRGPQASLVNEIVRYFGATIPSVVLQTAASPKVAFEEAPGWSSCLGSALNSALAGSPVLFLDVRDRNIHGLKDIKDRASLIDAAKKSYEEHSEKLFEVGLSDTFDVCAISFFHEVLFGDGDIMTTEDGGGRAGQGKPIPLHERILIDQRGIDHVNHDALAAPATSNQVTDTASWLADQIVRDAWRIRPKDGLPTERRTDQIPDETDDKTKYQEVWKPSIDCLGTHIRLLLSNQNFHHLNLCDTAGGARLVNELVQLDRVPTVNPLSGSMLLRQAWSEYDVVVYWARYYKMWSKALYIVQLLLAWLLVVATTVRNTICFGFNPSIESMDGNGDGSVSTAEFAEFMGMASMDSDGDGIISHVEVDEYMSSKYVTDTSALGASCQSQFQIGIFCTASAASFILFLDNMFFSTKRWRQLRSGAGSLESIIWMYRGRSGPFHTDKPEDVLNDVLGCWMDDLVAGADLSRTSIEQMYPQNVYRHCQFEGHLISTSSGALDDFHSPIQPDRYISLRLKPMMTFYQARIPQYTRSAMIMLLMLGMFSVVASALAFFGYADFVVVVTAAGASITSYLEFSDTQRKIERYTRAVRAIKKLLNWWTTLDVVERAGVDATSTLLTTGESIISDERLAWQPLNIGLGSINEAETEGQKQTVQHSNDIEKGGVVGGANRVHPG